MRLLEFLPGLPLAVPSAPCHIQRRGFGPLESHCPVGSPQLFWVTPCEKQERGGCVVAQGGREGGKESGAMGSLSSCMGGTPLCVSVPSGWPGAVCPADAHPHPDHRVCSQPDDGLQPTLQFEPQAVSTHSSKLTHMGREWLWRGVVGQGSCLPSSWLSLGFFCFIS